jgi:tetratricopeptide (TPR) repeat protein
MKILRIAIALVIANPAFSLIGQSSLDGEKALDEACQKADSKDYAGAIAAFDRCISIDPNNAFVYSMKARCDMDRNDLKSALDAIEHAITLESNRSSYYVRRGRIHNLLGKRDVELLDYNKAIALDPSNAEAYELRGSLRYLEGKYDDCIADETQALRLCKNLPWALFWRSMARFVKREYPLARSDIQMSLAMSTKNPRAFSLYAMILITERDYQSAIKIIDRGLKSGEIIAELYNAKTVAEFGRGDLAAALSDTEAALRIDPNDTDAKKNFENIKKATEPNKTLVPTPMAVTPPAGQEARQPQARHTY